MYGIWRKMMYTVTKSLGVGSKNEWNLIDIFALFWCHFELYLRICHSVHNYDTSCCAAKDVTFLYQSYHQQEPVELWRNLEGHNLLEKLYEDPQRWSFLFQSYVQLTRLNIHLQHTTNPVKMIERSLQNNR